MSTEKGQVAGVVSTQAPTFPSGAPGWKSSRYPMGGAKTGPGWQAVWDALDGDVWMGADALAEIGARTSGCSLLSMRTLLTRAANAAVLEREYRLSAGRQRVHYRRASQKYRDLVGLLIDGKFHTVDGERWGAEYLASLVERGALEQRWKDQSHYRLAWKVPTP